MLREEVTSRAQQAQDLVQQQLLQLRQLQQLEAQLAERQVEQEQNLQQLRQELRQEIQERKHADGKTRQAAETLDAQARDLDKRLSQRLASADSVMLELREDITVLEASGRKARHSLEAKASDQLQMGLQKLAGEVAERLEQERLHQFTALSVVDRRLTEGLEPRLGSAERRLEANELRIAAGEAWQSACQQRQLAQEQRLEAQSESLRRIDEHCQELPPRLELRLKEARAACKEDLAASVLSAFQGEIRLWAKVAQLGGGGVSGGLLTPMPDRWDRPAGGL